MGQQDSPIISQSSEDTDNSNSKLSLGRDDDAAASQTNKRVKLVDETSDPTQQQYSSSHHPAVTPAAPKTSNSTRTPLTCKKEIESLLWKEAGYNSSAATTTKRTDYISFDDFFMAVAVLSSHRSKDPINATGACIVDSANRIIGTGYNGFPVGCSDDALPWGSSSSSTNSESNNWLHTRFPYAVHAEVNAILNKCTSDCNGARLYTQKFPCADCAKVIIQSGIAEVVYAEDDDDCHLVGDRQKDSESIRASRILLTMAGVRMRPYKPTHQRVELDFTKALEMGGYDEDCVEGGDKCGKTSPIKDAQKTAASLHRDLLMKEANYDPIAVGSSKREGALSWDDYFLSMALLAAQRSKDPNTQVGACIVDPTRRIIGLGYNGFPTGCSDDDLPWARHSEQGELHKKYVFVVHAEVNAILNKGSASVRGATLYVALFPCNECAKVIVQSGIREVVYMSDHYHDTDGCRASRILFQMAGVHLRKHIPTPRSICIRLAKENSDNCKEPSTTTTTTSGDE